jgi:hypothetical protein
MYGDVSALYGFPALCAKNPAERQLCIARMYNTNNTVAGALSCDCIRFNPMHDIFLVDNIYLAMRVEEAHAMGKATAQSRSRSYHFLPFKKQQLLV